MVGSDLCLVREFTKVPYNGSNFLNQNTTIGPVLYSPRLGAMFASIMTIATGLSPPPSHGQPAKAKNDTQKALDAARRAQNLGDDSDHSQKALDLARRAQNLGDASDYRGAIALFKQASSFDDRAEYQCNVGVAYYELEDWPRANAFLGQCLARSSAIAVAHIASVRKIHHYVEGRLREGKFAPANIVTTPSGALIHASGFAQDETFPSPRVVWLRFGAHTLVISAPGHQAKTVPLQVVDNKQLLVRVTLPKRVGPKIATLQTASTPATRQLTPGVASKKNKPKRTAAWIVSGIAAASLVGGVTFHAMAIGTRDELADITDSDLRAKKSDQLDRERILMYSFYGVAVAAAGTATYLFLRRPKRHPKMSVVPTANAHGGFVQIRWSY